MKHLPRLASRVFNTPLASSLSNATIFAAVIVARLNGTQVEALVERESDQPTVELQLTTEGVACINISGTLVEKSSWLDSYCNLVAYTTIAEQLAAAESDARVKGILLIVDSPGGEVTGMLECSKAIAAITKPIYSAVSFCACSAAYLLAAQTDQIFVTESSLTGSIGVIAQHMEMSGSDAEAGLKYTTIFAGARKNDGNPHEPLSKGAQDAIQADVDSVMDMFIASVAAGRALPEADMRATEAAIYRGVQAVEAGLADVMGTPGDALLALAGIISTTSSVAAATRLRKEVRMKSTQVADPKLAANTAPPEEEPDDAKKEEAKATKKKAEDPADPEKEAEEDEEETLTGAACQEIAILCSIAGKSSLIAGFLQKQTSLAKVREHLLNAKADETTVITAAIDPSIGAQPKGAINPNDPKENPLLADAYRRQAAAEKQKGAR